MKEGVCSIVHDRHVGSVSKIALSEGRTDGQGAVSASASADSERRTIEAASRHRVVGDVDSF